MSSNFGLALTIAILPEAILVGVAGLCAVLGLIRPRERPDLYRWLACIALAGSIAASGVVLFGMRQNQDHVALVVWGGGLAVDHFSVFVSIAACVFALITCLLSGVYLRSVPSRSAGFFALVLLTTAATAALAAEREMVTMFIAFEVLVVCLTAIPALVKNESRSAEVAFKYFIEAGVASATLLYGFAILYGVTGSTDLRAVAAALNRAPGPSALGIAFVLLSLTFAAGGFPLRPWVARATSTTHATVAGFVIAMGTTAGVAAWVRAGISGFGAAVHPWTGLATAIVAIALVYAALTALREERVSRLIGTLASGQVALLLLASLGFAGGTAAMPAAGTIAMLFGLAVFGLATLSAFALLAMFQNAGLGDRREDFRGLAHRSPAPALLFAIGIGTLIGLPPLAGFVARLLIVESAIEAGYGWLAVVALVSIVITAIPVIRLIADMYAEPGEEVPFTVMATPRLARLTTVFVSLGAIYLTVLAQPLLMLARAGAGPLH